MGLGERGGEGGTVPLLALSLAGSHPSGCKPSRIPAVRPHPRWSSHHVAPNTHSWEVVEEELFSRSWMDARAVNPQPSEHILSLPAPPPARGGGGEGNRPWEDAAAQGHPWVHSMPWPSASGTGAERGRSRQTAARRLWATGEGLWSRGCRAGDASSVPGGIFSPSGTGGLVKPSLRLSKEALRLLQEELLERWLQGEAEHRGCASASNITMKHLHPCPEGRQREVWVRVHGAPVGPAWQRWHGVQL